MKTPKLGTTSPKSGLFTSYLQISGELETGILLVERRDAKQGKALRQWLEHQVLPAFGERILAVDTAVARQCAGLHMPDPRSDRDALMAATALVHGMTVVTRNVDNFAPTGIALINPWNQHNIDILI